MFSTVVVALAIAGHAESAIDHLQLLQQKMVLAPEKQWKRMRAAEPLNWIHFPKCGSSLVNVIIHMPGFCPVLDNITMSAEIRGPCFLNTWLPQACQQQCNTDYFFCGRPHHPVGNYSRQRGHLVGMFRDPDQRILSGYHDKLPFAGPSNNSDYIKTIVEGVCDLEELARAMSLPKRPILEFAESWKGGMTYQLLAPSDEQPTDPNRRKMTREDAAEAARRVTEGFAFVGITEEWDLSMCLFHKTFGGPCRASDFENTRPTFSGKSAQTYYDTSELMGWHDDIDEVVYTAALKVFHKNLFSLNVSHDTCQECYRSTIHIAHPRDAALAALTIIPLSLRSYYYFGGNGFLPNISVDHADVENHAASHQGFKSWLNFRRDFVTGNWSFEQFCNRLQERMLDPPPCSCSCAPAVSTRLGWGMARSTGRSSLLLRSSTWSASPEGLMKARRPDARSYLDPLSAGCNSTST
ncbi:unnamed protein product [Symbiodinium necroappetens]|uniref:Uncharacterized protein n=1 Tax=Symbiodinium necroappetens TaxID=1628268 RepID=A0A812W8U3_9DINO|nr:unnamed protein product [Symbiodinium necroappetens]